MRRKYGWIKVRERFVCQYLQMGCRLLALMIGDIGAVYQPMNPGEGPDFVQISLDPDFM